MQEPGQVKRLSVAVAVDGVTTLGPKGKLNYAPRSDDEMNRIKELVRSAVGYSAQRGDQISVINVRFDHGDEEGTNSALPAVLNFDKNDMMRVAELAVLLVMAAMVVFFGVRPLLSTAAGGGMPSMPLLAGVTGGSASPQRSEPQITLTSTPQHAAAPDARIDIARIEGQVKASSVKQVSEFVETHPEESVSILRAWLHESA